MQLKGNHSLKRLLRPGYDQPRPSDSGLGFSVDHFRHFLDRVPIAIGCGHTQTFLDFSEVADGFHVPAVESEDELPPNCDNPG